MPNDRWWVIRTSAREFINEKIASRSELICLFEDMYRMCFTVATRPVDEGRCHYFTVDTSGLSSVFSSRRLASQQLQLLRHCISQSGRPNGCKCGSRRLRIIVLVNIDDRR
uniref:Uncharacterized protein n=1 Tax=Pristionchus pacificus TaxID=54126 RepID=A0A2A6BVL6_PRIPA|eukprot:PDM69907.1 hypothetical protein PRIPAC_49119 [Pristionchus pacificus]